MVNISISLPNEGIYTVVINAYDIAGNVNMYSFNITRDCSPPSANIIFPSGTIGYFNSSNVNFILEVADEYSYVSRITILLNNTEVLTVNGHFKDSLSLTFAVPYDGLWNVTLLVEDAAGNVITKFKMIFVDTNPPVILGCLPQTNIVFVYESLSIEINATDLNSPVYFNLIINETQIYSTQGTYVKDHYKFKYGLQFHYEAVYIIKIEVKDSLDNKVILTYIVYADKTPANVEINYHGENNYTSSNSKIDILINDNMALELIEVKIDNNTIQKMEITEITKSIDLHITPPSEEGTHSLEIIVIDRVGNLKIENSSFIVDNTAPVVHYFSLPESFETYLPVIISWNISDNFEIFKIELYLNQTLSITTTETQSEVTIELSNGTYLIEFVATDMAGNSVIMQSLVTVTPDADTDMDGMSDIWESENGLNPRDPHDAENDNDSDGLTNLQEYELGTNPNDSDTDGDGLLDGDEVSRGLNPLSKDSDFDLFDDNIDPLPTINNWIIVVGFAITFILVFKLRKR